MNIKEGEALTLFKNAWKNGEAVNYTYTTSLSKKMKDGSYTRMTLAVSLIGDLKNDFDENMKTTECASIKIKEAWLSLDAYTNKNNETVKRITLVIKDADLVETKPLKQDTGKEIAAAEKKASKFGK